MNKKMLHWIVLILVLLLAPGALSLGDRPTKTHDEAETAVVKAETLLADLELRRDELSDELLLRRFDALLDQGGRKIHIARRELELDDPDDAVTQAKAARKVLGIARNLLDEQD